MPPRALAPAQTMPVRSWYSMQRWRRRAKHQLRAEPLCCLCKTKGLIVPATVADHFPPHTKAITTPSFAARSAAFASLATMACNRASNTRAIGATLASTAIRSIRRIRSIDRGEMLHHLDLDQGAVVTLIRPGGHGGPSTIYRLACQRNFYRRGRWIEGKISTFHADGAVQPVVFKG